MGKTKNILVIMLEESSSPMTQGNNILTGTTIGIKIMDESLPIMAAPTICINNVWLNMTTFKFYLNYKYYSTKAPAKKVCAEGEDMD